MDSDWRDQTYFGEHRLRFSYDASAARPGGGEGGSEGEAGGAGRGSDWVCEVCQAVNFGRCGRGLQGLNERCYIFGRFWGKERCRLLLA